MPRGHTPWIFYGGGIYAGLLRYPKSSYVLFSFSLSLSRFAIVAFIAWFKEYWAVLTQVRHFTRGLRGRCTRVLVAVGSAWWLSAIRRVGHQIIEHHQLLRFTAFSVGVQHMHMTLSPSELLSCSTEWVSKRLRSATEARREDVVTIRGERERGIRRGRDFPARLLSLLTDGEITVHTHVQHVCVSSRYGSEWAELYYIVHVPHLSLLLSARTRLLSLVHASCLAHIAKKRRSPLFLNLDGRGGGESTVLELVHESLPVFIYFLFLILSTAEGTENKGISSPRQVQNARMVEHDTGLRWTSGASVLNGWRVWYLLSSSPEKQVQIHYTTHTREREGSSAGCRLIIVGTVMRGCSDTERGRV